VLWDSDSDVLEQNDGQGAKKVNDAVYECLDEHGDCVVAVTAAGLTEIPFDPLAKPGLHPANVANGLAEDLLGDECDDADSAGGDKHRDTDERSEKDKESAHKKNHDDEFNGAQAPIGVTFLSRQNIIVFVDDDNLPFLPVQIGAFRDLLAGVFSDHGGLLSPALLKC